MAQPGSIGSTSFGASENVRERSHSAPAGSLAHVVPIIQEPPANARQITQDMREPPIAGWGDFIVQLTHSLAVMPSNIMQGVTGTASLGFRSAQYLLSPEGQIAASVAMTFLENNKGVVRELMDFSKTSDGEAFFNTLQDVAAGLPRIVEQVNPDPDLKKQIISTMHNLSQTTQSVVANTNFERRDLENLLNATNTLCDGVKGSRLANPPEPEDVFHDALDHDPSSSVIGQLAQISSAQATRLIDGMLDQGPTEAACLVSMITRNKGDINQIFGELAAYIMDTAINNFTSHELDTIAASIVDKFRPAIRDLANDDKLRLIHALLENNPFGAISTRLMRALLPSAHADPIIPAPMADPVVLPPVIFGQRIRNFFAPVGNTFMGVIQYFTAFFTPPTPPTPPT